MPKLPAVTGGEAVAAFGRAGFAHDRTTASHKILKKPGHPFTLSVPVHGAKTVKRGTLRALIKDAGLTIEDFISFLRRR
jgi:predicted RNA binding protein YcfA (HicA-like mRNA interferase family)